MTKHHSLFVFAWLTVLAGCTSGIASDGHDEIQSAIQGDLQHTVGLKSPGRGMHFTQGSPLVVFTDVFDTFNWAHPITCPSGENPTYPSGGGQATCASGGAPVGWPKSQVLIDGVLQTDTVTNATTVPGSTVVNNQGNPAPVNFYRFNIVGLTPGSHQLVARGLYAPPPYSNGGTVDSAAITITVDPLPAGKTTLNLAADISGTVTWDNVIVVGNGHRVSPSGNLVIRNSLVRGLSGLQGSVASADISGSIFEDTGPVALTLGAGVARFTNNEFRANNRLAFEASNPSVPVILSLSGPSATPKTFQGNRMGAGIMEFSGQQWLIGGASDAQSNVFIGPRSVLTVNASQSVIKGNYSYHNYRGGWSQGFNFILGGSASDLVTEHNFIRGGSWPLQNVAGEFRYNVIYSYGHNWIRSLASGTRVHHNLFAPEPGGGSLDSGIWAYGGESNVAIYNNTFDGGGTTGDFANPTILMNGGSKVSSLRNNLITFSRNQSNGNPGSARVAGDDSSYGYLDYNAFYSPDNSNKDNYLVNLPGKTEGTPGFAGHDVNGVNGQLAASPFSGARIDDLDGGGVVDEGAVWQGTQPVSAVLAAFRARYLPVAGASVVNAGDPLDNDGQGRRADIGAIDRDGHDQDQLGKFGTPSSDPTPPTVAMAAPTAGATLSGTTTLSATASDNVGVAGVQFLIDGAPTGAEDTAAPYSLSFNTGAVANGSHTFSARARDAAGNVQTSPAMVATVSNSDTLAPTVVMTAPTAGATLSGMATLAANASDDVGVVGVQFLVDGAPTGAEKPAAPYSLSFDTGAVTNGNHTFSARARDAAGHTKTSSSVMETINNAAVTAAYRVNVGGGAAGAFTTDQSFNGGRASATSATVATAGVVNAAPQAVYQSGRYGTFTYTMAGLTPGLAYTVRLHFAEIYWTTVGARLFNVSLNNSRVLSAFDIVVAAGGARRAVVREFPATASGSGQILVQFTTVKDNAFVNGFEILAASGSGAADTQAPTVSLAAPAAGATLTGTTTLSANASDNVGVVGVQFLVDGIATGAEDTAAPYALSLGSTTLANGSHSFSARARDAAGNVRTSAGVAATVSNPTADTQPPTVGMTAPTAGATLPATATLAANATDNVGVVGVQFLVDGVATGAEDTTAPYSFSINTSNLASGSHTFAARARDAAGNTSTSSGIVATVAGSSSSSPPKLMSQAEIQQIASNPTDWSARKTACDRDLGTSIGSGYAGWDWHDAAVRYGTCYVVAKFLGDPAMPSYARKTIALMKVLARYHMYGTPDSSQELLAAGNGATRVFNLRMAPLAGHAVTVYQTPLSQVSFTYSGTTAALPNFFPIIKISNTPGGAASYTAEADYHLGYYNTLQWLPGGAHPAAGATYYVTLANQAFTALPAGSVTVSGTTLTLASAPASGQAIFVAYIGTDYEQTGNFMGGVDSIKPDGPGYPMRTMNVGLAQAYDFMRQSTELTPALRQEFYTVLNAEVDWYAQFGYERDGDLGNYFIRGRLIGNVFTAYATDDDNPRAKDTSAIGLKAVARDLLMNTDAALSQDLPGGYGPQGTYANGVTSDVLQLFDLWKRLTGEDLASQLAWTSNVVLATIHGTKPNRVTFYDGGDWNELPALPLTSAMQSFVAYQPNHVMAPFARQLLADAGSPVTGAKLDYKTGSAAFPLSYRAAVSGPVYARSDWGSGAVWLSLAAGPIIGDHQHRDQGHLTLQRGSDYLVVNSGAYGLTDTLPYHNTLGFDDRGVGNLIVYPPGQGYWGNGARIAKYREGGGFVYSQADFGSAYINNDGVRNSVTRAVRSLFYLRPDIVVVHDQAQTAQAGVKKTFNLNFNAPTVTQSGNTFSAVTGQSKVFMRSILPANPAPTITRLGYNGGTANVSNYQVTQTGATVSSFLHVFQVTDASRTQMAGAVYVASTDARAQGVEVDAGSQRWIALSASSSSTPLSGALTYSLPIAGTCGHLVGDLLALTQYQVTARSSGGAQLQQFLAATGSDGLLSFSTTDPATATVLLTPVGAAP